MIDWLRDAAALEALGDRLFATPREVADVIERDIRSVYAALKHGEIPHTRIGQRYQVPVGGGALSGDLTDAGQPG